VEAIEDWKALKEELGVECMVIDKILVSTFLTPPKCSPHSNSTYSISQIQHSSLSHTPDRHRRFQHRYIPPHPQRGIPYHRYVLLVLPQPPKSSLSYTFNGVANADKMGPPQGIPPEAVSLRFFACPFVHPIASQQTPGSVKCLPWPRLTTDGFNHQLAI
jgi:hypothetical protein